MNHASRRSIQVLISVFAIIVGDQLSKVAAISMLRGRLPLISWGDLFRFEYAENPGAFLNLGSTLPTNVRFWLLSIAVGVFLFGLFVYLIRTPKLVTFEVVALTLVLGGGVSNLLDRLFRPGGRVIDFMNMGLGELRTGIFNVADVLIMAGIIGFLLFSLLRTKEQTEPVRG